MRLRFLLLLVTLLSILLATGCGDDDRPPGDAGMTDGTVPDGGDGDGGGGPVGECWVPDTPGPTITTCPGDALEPPAEGTCTITAGDDAILITGDVLTPGEVFRGGQVLVDASGAIACVGCDCSGEAGAASATQVVCPDGVVSPGLINPHEHITFPAAPASITEERYEHRHDWRTGARGHNEISSGGRGDGLATVWSELRHLLGGATSVNGSGSGDGLLRNLDRASASLGLGQPEVEYDTFPLGDTSGTLRDMSCDYGTSRTTAADIASEEAYTPHIAEGIDAESRNELICQREGEFDLIAPQTAVVHGIGVRPEDIGELAADGTSLIWSPRSNVALYGDTARVSTYATMGVRIALGTDWLRSGSMNMLRELQCADLLNTEYFNGYFTDEQLWLMATRDAAGVLAMDDAIGVIAPGRVADITIFAAGERADHRAVIDAAAQDVVLVLRSGDPLYGDQTLVDGLASSCDALDVCGVSKSVCVGDTGASLADIMASAPDYELFYCGEPAGEPTCVPQRNAMAPLPDPVVDMSTRYTGEITSGDGDGDGIADADDNCPCAFNPIRPLDMGAQPDSDGDGLGDDCDPCPLDADTTECSSGFDPEDRDRDGVPAAEDNCPSVANEMQEDGDGDGIGDACDPCPERAIEAGSQTVYGVRCGAVGTGMTVTVSDLAVTAVGESGFFAQHLEGSADYDGVDLSGIFVFTGTAPTVTRGDVVDVMGTIEEYFGLTQLVSPTVTVSASGMEPAPTVVEPADIVTDGPRAEALEAVFVRVDTVTVMDPDLGFGEFSVDDGLRVDDQLYAADPPPGAGDMLGFVQGPLAYSFMNTKILPRDIADIGFQSLRLGPSDITVEPAGTVTLTVALPMPAPVGGAAVTITPSPATILVGAPTIVVPEGMRVASADYTASATEAMGTVTASYDGDTAMATVNVAEAPRLIFSEYVEGSSNNKALELLNLGGSEADLSTCTIRRYTNGSTSPTTIALSGMLASGATFTICNGGLDMAATRCDVTSGNITHNGDDAYDLVCSDLVVDTFGRIGEDPGEVWMGGGLSTAEYILTRKCSVTTGDTDGSDAFDPSVEWEGDAWVDPAMSLAGLGNRSECP